MAFFIIRRGERIFLTLLFFFILLTMLFLLLILLLVILIVLVIRCRCFHRLIDLTIFSLHTLSYSHKPILNRIASWKVTSQLNFFLGLLMMLFLWLCLFIIKCISTWIVIFFFFRMDDVIFCLGNCCSGECDRLLFPSRLLVCTFYNLSGISYFISSRFARWGQVKNRSIMAVWISFVWLLDNWFSTEINISRRLKTITLSSRSHSIINLFLPRTSPFLSIYNRRSFCKITRRILVFITAPTLTYFRIYIDWA